MTLADRMARVPDDRAVRGLRHRLVVVLVLAARAAPVVGNGAVAVIRRWAAGTEQDVRTHRTDRWRPTLAVVGSDHDEVCGYR